MTEKNPLSRYFRQPTIYMRLPSGGQHYPPGALDLPANNELPVFPMTVRDEIINKTPDALFNGTAVVSLIQSCIPNIKDAWSIPSVDLDSILIAIKVATYGKDLEITGSCTHCQESSDYVIDLNRTLAEIGVTNYNSPQRIGQFEIVFRPLSYQEINETSQEQFNEQKILNILPDSGLSDQERVQEINKLIVKITDGTISALSKSISSIRTDDVLVSNEQQIHEFLDNCPTALFTAIRDAAIAKRQAGAMKPLKLTCNHCTKQYEQILTLDLSNFFVPSS
jgi:hypothetical protein